MKSARLVLTIVTGYLTLTANLYSAPPSAEELERKAISYRLEKVRKGYIRIHVTDDPSRQPLERLYESTFDEERVRQVRWMRLLGKDQWGEAEKIIVTPKLYMNDPENLTASPPAVLRPTNNYVSRRETSRVLNWQALGMDIHGIDFLHTANVESLLNRANRSNVTVQADKLEGLETWRIEYKLKRPNPNPAYISIWIAPNQGYSVVRIKLRENWDDKESTSLVDSQLRQYPDGNIWFPHKVIRTLEFEGRVLARQVAAVEEAHFGGPVDETAFTPAGLELKPGREVVDSTSGTPWLKVWEGKKLVDPSGVKTAPPPRLRPRRPRWLLLSLSAGLGLLSFIYFWRVIRQRRSGSNPGS